MGSPEQVIEEHFERDEVKAVLANLGAWSMLPLQEPGSGGVLAMMCSYFRWGVTRPVGGSGEFTKALAACVTAHGGEIRTSARVEEVLVRDGESYGVRLESGEELRSRHVIGAVDPYTLMAKLVDQAHVPEQTQGELRAMGNLRWNITLPEVRRRALTRTPELACGRPELKQGYLLLGPTIEYVKQAQAASMVGELPEQMPMGPMFPSLLDRSQVPPGSEGETVYLYMQAVPRELSGGRDWDDGQGRVHRARDLRARRLRPGAGGERDRPVVPEPEGPGAKERPPRQHRARRYELAADGAAASDPLDEPATRPRSRISGTPPPARIRWGR